MSPFSDVSHVSSLFLVSCPLSLLRFVLFPTCLMSSFPHVLFPSLDLLFPYFPVSCLLFILASCLLSLLPHIVLLSFLILSFSLPSQAVLSSCLMFSKHLSKIEDRAAVRQREEPKASVTQSLLAYVTSRSVITHPGAIVFYLLTLAASSPLKLLLPWFSHTPALQRLSPLSLSLPSYLSFHH